ncbi:MAG: hypothetical protein HC837_08130 [Chloroflexaceae bacterium]|nr:hypothetical protein [Chloroflexaceae bacterium]
MLDGDPHVTTPWVLFLLRLIQGAIAFDRTAFETARLVAGLGQVVLVIVFFAGVSQSLSQHGDDRFFQKGSPMRFCFSHCFSGIMFVIGALFLTVMIWLIATVLFQSNEPMNHAIWAVSLGYAPMLLGFLISIPYLGHGIARLVRLWTFLALIVAARIPMELDIWPAIATTSLALLLVELLQCPIAHPFLLLIDRLWFMATVVRLAEEQHQEEKRMTLQRDRCHPQENMVSVSPVCSSISSA